MCIDGLQFAIQPDSYKGSLNSAPWIRHTGDDRSGSEAAGESIKVNLDQCHNINRINIYAFIYEGATAWNKTDAVVTVKVPGQPSIEGPLGDENRSERFCVIATLEFSPQGDITVTRNMTWHSGGHQEMDRAYDWGMQWQAGSK